MLIKPIKILGITALISLFTGISGCDILTRPDKDEVFKDYTGNWQIISITGNEKEENFEDQEIKLQLAVSDQRLIGTLIPDFSSGASFGVIDLDINRVENNQLIGNFWLFGIEDKGINIPVTVEINEEKDQITSIIKMTEIDKTSFPEDIRENLESEKIFDDNWTIVATNKDVSSNSDSFNNQANKGKQSEAKQNVSTLNRGQQAYYLENGRFTDNLEALGIGIKSETENYSYHLNLIGENVHNFAIAKQENLKTYTGGVFLLQVEGSEDPVSQSILCESDQPTQDSPPPPFIEGNEIVCPSGFSTLR